MVPPDVMAELQILAWVTELAVVLFGGLLVSVWSPQAALRLHHPLLILKSAFWLTLRTSGTKLKPFVESPAGLESPDQLLWPKSQTDQPDFPEQSDGEIQGK